MDHDEDVLRPEGTHGKLGGGTQTPQCYRLVEQPLWDLPPKPLVLLKPGKAPPGTERPAPGKVQGRNYRQDNRPQNKPHDTIGNLPRGWREEHPPDPSDDAQDEHRCCACPPDDLRTT